MAVNNTENVADLSNIAAYNDYDESGESDLEDLNGEERTDMPADGDNSDSGGEENTRGYHIHKRLLTTNRIVNSIDACFEVDNFDEIHVPLISKAYAKDEVLVGHLGPKTNANTPTINWTTKPNANAGRQHACDIIRSAASTVRYADGINNIDDCFSEFINADMIEMIVLRSNIKINSYLENHSDKVGHHKYPFLRITDFIEIRALIGLIFFRGLGTA